jgi:hypothetical protein
MDYALAVSSKLAANGIHGRLIFYRWHIRNTPITGSHVFVVYHSSDGSEWIVDNEIPRPKEVPPKASPMQLVLLLSGDPSAPVDVELQDGLNHLSYFWGDIAGNDCTLNKDFQIQVGLGWFNGYYAGLGTRSRCNWGTDAFPALPFALSVKALCLDGPRAHLLGYSALSTLRKARRVEARLSRFQTIAKSVVGDRPLIGR